MLGWKWNQGMVYTFSKLKTLSEISVKHKKNVIHHLLIIILLTFQDMELNDW